VVLQPRLLLDEELERGNLIEILSDSVPTPMSVHILYKSKGLTLKTRTFIEFVLAAMKRV